jgi:fluoroacetyl-CoA thioesterase
MRNSLGSYPAAVNGDGAPPAGGYVRSVTTTVWYRPVPLEQGLRAAFDYQVTDDDTTIAVGCGDVPALATPRVLALCEKATVEALTGHLDEGKTSVGMRVQLDHLAPTGVGDTLRIEAVLEEIEGARLSFKVTVNDDRGLVAVGRVSRVVVNRARFLEKLP